MGLGLCGLAAARPNVVSDLTLPAETQWNRFLPGLIPDFTIPERFDPVLGTKRPVKIFVWQQPGRNCFATVTNGSAAARWSSERKAMLKKGVTAVYYHYLRPNELLKDGEDPAGEHKLPFNPATQVTTGNGTADDATFHDDWRAWAGWWERNVDDYLGPLSLVKTPEPAPLFLTFPDYEARHCDADSQDDVNFLVAGLYSLLNRTRGYVAYMSPINSLGHLREELYQGGNKTAAWFLPADDSVPEAYRGKKLEGHPRMAACAEVAHWYESWLPEGRVIKDQQGEDWLTITHFGQSPNAEHWAARVAGLYECINQYTQPAGQHSFAMLKVACDRGNGFQYNPDSGAGNDGKWIQDFNRHGITLSYEPGKEVLSATGSEMISNFGAEGQVMLAYFSGVEGIVFWGSACQNEFRPKPRKGNPERGEKYNDPDYGNVNREPMTYTLKAQWRLAQKVRVSATKQYSFFDICDGTEEYLTFNTEVSYDGGKSFVKSRALDWQREKRTAVRAVVNRAKGVLFILALQPYGVEQDSVVVRYQEGRTQFKKTLAVPPGKIVLNAYALGE